MIAIAVKHTLLSRLQKFDSILKEKKKSVSLPPSLQIQNKILVIISIIQKMHVFSGK